MDNLTTELLESALLQYQNNCHQIAVTRVGDPFSEALYARLEDRLSLSEQLLLHRALTDRDAALFAVRNRQYAIADQLFAEARRVLNSAALSEEAKLLHRSLLYQSETYLDYCHGEFAIVRQKIETALELDSILEEHYGYDVLHLHRIQLLHNIARTDARCEEYDRALTSLAQLLSYLEGQCETLPIGTAWGHDRMARQPVELVKIMIAQITSEIAIVLATQDFEQAAVLFQLAIPDDLAQGSDWLSLKQVFLKRDRVSFLKRAARFLETGRNQVLLWYATLVDLLQVCRSVGEEFDCAIAKQLYCEIVKDAIEQRQTIPAKFRGLLLADEQVVLQRQVDRLN